MKQKYRLVYDVDCEYYKIFKNGWFGWWRICSCVSKDKATKIYNNYVKANMPYDLLEEF